MDRATFGKYVLLRKLATGGMGEVFLAKQCGPSGFEKLLVIKRILAQHHDKHEYLNMFLSEARLVAYLTHSNIIQIHEMGQIDGDYFIAMEYVRGKSLRDVIDALRAQGRSLPLPYVIDLAIKLCDGLGYAHEARDIRGRPMNIIHRDINPHNILISYSGDLKLIDFGIAKSEMTSVHTATGTIKGKFVYMSPEQSAADPIDRKSDIFSLGIVLYEMITGENPFVRQNVVLSLEAIQRHPVAPPSAKRPDAGPLDAVLEKALEKKPENRFQNAYEMRDELRNLLRSGLVKPADTDLSSFLSELFAPDIDEEDRLLAEADRATTPPAPSMGHAHVPAPTLPPNLPSMPMLGSRPPSSPSSAVGDHDTKADRPLITKRTPQPIHAQPFSDEEETIAGELEELAAKSRLQSVLSKAGSFAEPTGQVLTLIPPEEVAPGTSEEYGHKPRPEPHTKRERVPNTGAPSDPGSAVFRSQPPSPPPGTDMAASLPPLAPPPPPPPASIPPPSPEAMAAFMEPLSPAPGALPPMPPFQPLGGRKEPTPINGQASRGHTPLERPALENRSDPPADLDLSGSLPIYTGISRRSTLIAGALVFLLAAIAGFWGVRSLMSMWSAEPEVTVSDPIPPQAAVPPVVPPPGVPVEPAADPTEPAPRPVAPKAADETPVSAKTVPDRPVVERKPVRDEPPRERRKKSRRSREREREPAPAPVAPVAEKQPEPEPERKPVVVEKPVEEKPAPREEPKPVAKAEEPRKEASKGRLGILTVSASSEVSVEHEGRGIGSAPSSIMVKGESGTVSLGGGNLQYTVKLSYRVLEDGLAVKIDANPWAIVKHNGISLGKTPQGPVSGKRHRIALLRPGQDAPFVVSLIWNPSR